MKNIMKRWFEDRTNRMTFFGIACFVLIIIAGVALVQSNVVVTLITGILAVVSLGLTLHNSWDDRG